MTSSQYELIQFVSVRRLKNTNNHKSTFFYLNLKFLTCKPNLESIFRFHVNIKSVCSILMILMPFLDEK